ncbi:MAG TPA: NADH-quinone oxidoreductase subunit C, partial [Gemmatimonadaceae bacterium]|nr:NADH-quinone oxidoreductase subunit C [Gemmatimonadaceae bacterium]
IVSAGSALEFGARPVTPRNLPQKGGEPSPSVAALSSRFPGAVLHSEVIWGDTNVYIAASRVIEVMQWLRDDATQQYDYLSDVTAVESRDFEQPIEVVWHLRSLPFRRFLRVKTQLDKSEPLEVPSVWGIWKAADWMERECYDMFGIRFTGHPDLRRILMWEQYKEGYPLRKDFPLRGRFSRSEQLMQALSQNPEAKYSMEELSIADAFEDLPEEMRQRLGRGEQVGE